MKKRLLSMLALLYALLFVLSACSPQGGGDVTDTPTDTEANTPSEVDTSGETDGETTVEEPEPEIPVVTGPEPGDHITAVNEVYLSMTDAIQIKSHNDNTGVHCRVVQGGCTDGTYYYVALNDGQSKNAESVSAVRKYEIATGKLVATFEGLNFAHGNDLTYNPDTNEFIVVHNSPERQVISIYDAATFTLKEKKTIELEIYSMAYDPYEKCYWVGISKCYDFAKLDLDFNVVGDIYPGYETGYTKQGMDLDSKYLYFCQWNKNCIIAYDKEGNFVRQIDLPMTSYEAENIFHIDDTFYIAYYKTPAGGTLYKTTFEEFAPKGIDVTMSKYMELDTFTDKNGNLCKVAQGSCTDGKYLYFAMNNDVSSSYVTAIYKIDLATKKIVATYEGLSTGLTNDITYNPKTKQIVAVHNKPTNTEISILDAETMTLVEKKKISQNVYSAAYDSVNDCYWFGISNSFNFVKLDSSFNQVGSVYSGYSSGYTKQGMECDGKYIYFIQSAKNSVVVYDTDGKFIGIKELPVTSNSAQNIACVDDIFYIGYNDSNAGAILYTAEIDLGE